MNHAVSGTGMATSRRIGRSRWAIASMLSAVLLNALPGCLSASAQNTAAASVTDSDVDRLRGLLLRHRGGADETTIPQDVSGDDVSTASFDASPGESPLSSRLKAPYSAEKLLLRPDEWPLLSAEVEARLADTTITERRSDSPLIGTLQVRQRGSLVGSSTYNLRHIGKHQFIGQTKLGEGRNILGVSDFQREIELPALEGSSEHLLLLTAPPRQDWTLHLVPVTALPDRQSDRPPWIRDASTEASTAP